jgi:NADH-quinone oxidoreductase subunit H
MPDFLLPVVDFLKANIHWIALAFVIHNVVLGTCGLLIYLERKVASWAQDRIGPNRVGFDLGILSFLKGFRFLGLGQSLADGIKMFTKEDYRSPNTDRFLFTVAPMIMMVVVVVSIAVIPWGGTNGRLVPATDITTAVSQGASIPQAIANKITPGKKLVGDVTVTYTNLDDDYLSATYYLTTTGVVKQLDQVVPTGLPALTPGTVVSAAWVEGWRFQIADLNIGVLFILSILSLAVYGVVIGGWASNNKYSFLGGLRATANMISYEIPLGLSVLAIVIMFGTLNLGDIVAHQTGYWLGVIPAWNVFAQPLCFVLFLVCIHAEANRAPFDIAEAEQELVGGYHTEYSSMRFGLFFLAEYAGMITTSAVCVALFFGGWHLPFADKLPYIGQYFQSVVPQTPGVYESLLVNIFNAGVFFAKTALILFVFMWVRWSLPRFRFDQIMTLAWRMMIPVALGLLFAAAIGVYVTGGRTINGLGVREAIIFIAGNVAVAVIALAVHGLLPEQSHTNKRVKVAGSRYAKTPLPAGM